MYGSAPLRWMAVATALTVQPVLAQSAPTDYRDEIMRHFEQSSRKIVSLAHAMPEELYSWAPGEGIMPVAQVYAHIARYNFMYLEDQLGIAPPHGVDVPRLEEITDKAQITALLERSVEHVRRATQHMMTDVLTDPTRLYGRDVPGWAVLLQLVAHMNEHVGQSVAYARMNNIVPPWSS